jgi:undecaprenyl pyrophosphate phosphatase UppP
MIREDSMTPLIQVLIALIGVAIAAWVLNALVPLPRGLRGIVNVVLALIVVGIALWLINVYVPMAGSIKAILNIVVIIATCVGVLQAVGLWPPVVRLWNGFTHRLSHPSPSRPESWQSQGPR